MILMLFKFQSYFQSVSVKRLFLYRSPPIMLPDRYLCDFITLFTTLSACARGVHLKCKGVKCLLNRY